MRARFLTPLELRYIDGHTWELAAPLIYHSKVANREFYVPTKARTDFASIPRALWWLYPPTGNGKGKEYGPGAVIHDRIYETHEVDRKMGDEVLLEAMEVKKVTYLTRYNIYWSVRTWGWTCW